MFCWSSKWTQNRHIIVKGVLFRVVAAGILWDAMCILNSLSVVTTTYLSWSFWIIWSSQDRCWANVHCPILWNSKYKMQYQRPHILNSLGKSIYVFSCTCQPVSDKPLDGIQHNLKVMFPIYKCTIMISRVNVHSRYLGFLANKSSWKVLLMLRSSVIRAGYDYFTTKEMISIFLLWTFHSYIYI